MRIPVTILATVVWVSLLSARGQLSEPPAIATPAPGWDALFRNTNGWIGADGSYSVALSNQTTLWLFSDTFVGEIRDGQRFGARMVNNSVALQQGTNPPTFYYGANSNGIPEAFIKPKTGKGYFWLGPAVRGPRGLYMFLNQNINVRSDTPFGFKFLDCWLGHVSNPDDPPSRWHITQTKIPFSKLKSKGSLIFGGAVLAEGDYAYIYGNDTRPWVKLPTMPGVTVVARAPLADLGDFKKWTFFSKGQWQADFTKASPIAPGFASEFSVSRLFDGKQYVAVYSEGLGGRIVMRLARAPEGPWSNAMEAFRVPEVNWNVAVFSYGGKAHPELVSAPNELLVTYSANSWSFRNLLIDDRLYWPRFVRVKLE